MKIVPKKKVVPKPVIALCSAGYLVCPCLVIYSLITYNPVTVALFVVLFLLLVIAGRGFSWYVKAELYESDGVLMYVVQDPVSVSGSSETRYYINSIERMKSSGKNLTLYGKIYVKEPLQSKREIKKCVIMNADESVENFVRRYM